MFCQKCGAELPDGARFCSKCGTDQDAFRRDDAFMDSKMSSSQTAVTPGENVYSKAIKEAGAKTFGAIRKIKPAYFIGIFVAIAIIIIAASIVSASAKRVDFNDFMEVSFEGYDTRGTLLYEFDMDEFYDSYKKQLEKKGITGKRKEKLEKVLAKAEVNNFEFENTSGLSNGDEVLLTWNIDEEKLKKELGLISKTGEKKYLVEGLKEIKTFDPFDYVDILFSGVSPDVKVSITPKTDSEELQYIRFYPDKTENLKEGDEVSITASLQMSEDDFADKFGMLPDKEMKQYTVSGLDRYVNAVSDNSSQEAENVPDAGWKDAFVAEVERLSKEYKDSYDSPDYILVDVNRDEVPELIAFSSEGRYAWISIYNGEKAVAQKLFDNQDKPEGFTDYGAYASIVCDKHQIIKIEYDSTYEKDGGWNTPGAELMDPDGREYDEFTYLTVYEINDDMELTEKDKYSCQYHYPKQVLTDPYDYDWDDYTFVEAFHNDVKITEAEYMDIRNSVLYESDVDFGSSQDAAHELPAEQMIELLRGDPIMYKVVNSFADGSDNGSVCLEYDYRTEDGSTVHMNKYFRSSELPSGIKTGDELRYSLNDGWEKASD